jgi:WD40 repeat protein
MSRHGLLTLLTMTLLLGALSWRTIAHPAQAEPCIGRIAIFAVSPDGTLLAAYTPDVRMIQVFELDQGTKIDEIRATKEIVSAISFSADKKLIAWGESDDGLIGGSMLNGTLLVYERKSHSIVASLANIADLIDQIKISTGTDTVTLRGSYPGSDRYDIQVWDIANQSRISIRESWWVAPAYTGDPETIFFGTIDYPELALLIKWDGLTADERQIVGTHAKITAMTLSEDRAILVSADDAGNLILWNTSDLTQMSSAPIDIPSAIDLAFIDENTLVVTGNFEYKDGFVTAPVSVWRITPEPDRLAHLSLPLTQVISPLTQFVTVVADQTIYLLTGSDDSTQIMVWDYAADTLTPVDFSCD